MAFQERMNAALYRDLSTDRNMSWVWPNAYLTYLTLDAPYDKVTYDMGVSSSGILRVAPFGTPPMRVAERGEKDSLSASMPHLPLGTPQVALGLSLLLSVVTAIVVLSYLALRTPGKPRATAVKSGNELKP